MAGGARGGVGRRGGEGFLSWGVGWASNGGMGLAGIFRRGVGEAQYSETVPGLRLERVSKDYPTDAGQVAALREVTLEVERGEFCSLVGRSGCGKSTLLNLCGAMDFPTSGAVWIDGKKTGGLSEGELTRLRREKVGFVFQSFQLLANLSVVENVELPLLLARVGGARGAAMGKLAEVGMEELAGRYPHQLSGGQMQRVAIARALVHEPAILLADEPTGNLDTATGAAILELLSRIARERGTLVLMATHSAEAAALTDRVIHLRDGLVECDERLRAD